MADDLTFHDCCRTILSNWHLREEGTVPELRDYHRAVLAFLTKEFGIRWEDDPDFAARERLPYVVSNMPRKYIRLNGPYANYLEYSFRPGEEEVWGRHRDRLNDIEREFKERWVALFRDLLLLRWPEAARRTTSSARMQALGLGEPPDEFDLF